MRKYFTIILLVFYLFSSTELSQVIKLPIFIEHFKEHSAVNPKLTLFGFIKLHYFNGDPDAPDYETNMKLPFKKHDLYLVTSVIIQDIPKAFNLEIKAPSFEESKTRNFFYTIGEIPSPLFSIFQPPKVA
ncbi:hypothetical protein [Elizabethkingia miricola]|uniref:Uncharacterized protein n=1 Tax=Elizabethkingia miricola TaxID=172045 RepID=A0ABD5B1E2_ELIMR|nr:hypothetical protein [Elizabethkingia miricola]MDQ8747262.1 hypothetical protein [Elizabethkingia miricola]NHQ66154.1 hypothetical protein [Elizabethkingia miricola]NHQ69238.1 hypothetical protein [Elizabethkingia miricola]NHQ77755.1 hypothetical protein [Elizabethkingia miricola]OPB85392.1 hypothetical protein BAS06_18060 [Elizabethkingia miricola]